MWLKIVCFVLLLSAVFGKDLKRSLKVDVKDAEVKIDNKADNGDEKAHVMADIRLNHNDGLFVKYSAKAKNSTTMVDVDFTVSFDSIVEFVYKNGEAYNPATDTATKHFLWMMSLGTRLFATKMTLNGFAHQTRLAQQTKLEWYSSLALKPFPMDLLSYLTQT